jgi:ParB family chromosome partitioning protein
MRQIPIVSIAPNPYQPRQQFNPERLAELAESIKVHGLVQPIVVRREASVQTGEEPRYLLVAGERRWRAAALAGLTTVPAIVREVPDSRVLELTLIENIQREDLNPIEVAEALARLASEASLTHEQIAERTGKDRATITNLLRLLKLPVEVRERVASGALSAGHAKVLLGLASEEAQKTLAARIVAQGLSVRQTEEEARHSQGRPVTTRTIFRAIQKAAMENPNVRAAVLEMERTLGTRVRLVGDDLHGKIIIEYHTSDDLDRIYAWIVDRR